MAKKDGKPGKSKDAERKPGFSFAGIDIPEALRSNGVTVDALTRHPLVAGLAAMALEALASQIRAKAATAPAPAVDPDQVPVKPPVKRSGTKKSTTAKPADSGKASTRRKAKPKAKSRTDSSPAA